MKQAVITRLAEREVVTGRHRSDKGDCQPDLRWTMGITLPILRSLRTRILALVLGLVTLVVAAMAIAIAVKARAEVERQVAVQLSSAAHTARGTRSAAAPSPASNYWPKTAFRVRLLDWAT